MKSRRLIAGPKFQDKASYQLKLAHWKGAGCEVSRCPLWVKSGRARRKKACPLYPNSDIDCVFRHVCFGPKADIRTAQSHVRFTPKATSTAANGMSAKSKKRTSGTITSVSRKQGSYARQSHPDFGELARPCIDLD